MKDKRSKGRSDDVDNTKTFEFLIKRKDREVKLGIQEHKKGESKESVEEENEKEAKESYGFMTTKEESQIETSKESSKKSWSDNAQNIQGTESQKLK